MQVHLRHVKNLLSVDVTRTAPDAANAKKQDSDILNCVNEVVDAQMSIKSYFALTGIFC